MSEITGRKVQCAKCSWCAVPSTLDPLEVARCSGTFEQHLVVDHGADREEAQAAAEAWALVALRGQVL